MIAFAFRKLNLLLNGNEGASRSDMVIGLTGGMGCGKSTVARQFESLGYSRLDSDEVIRNQLLVQEEVIAEIVARFGPRAVGKTGEINRGWIASVIFENEEQRRWLESILHPRLFADWRRRLVRSAVENWILEVPLLFEKQLENWFDFTLCVTTTPENQLVRLEQRGISRAHAELRISKQLPLARKVELADFVIGNDGTPDFLRLQVVALVGTFAARY